MNSEEMDRRILAAQSIPFDLDDFASEGIKTLVRDNSDAIGCPVEFMYFPLLSLGAHFMGPGTSVLIKKGWKEPVIVWTVKLADKGQKKSPALNCFTGPINSMEKALMEEAKLVETDHQHGEGDEESDDTTKKEKERLPQIAISHFSMEELHYTLKRNGGRIIGLYDEVTLLYDQLDKYKSGSSDRKTFLSLINGSPWRRNFRNSNSYVEKPWFNIAGFVQPDAIINMMNG